MKKWAVLIFFLTGVLLSPTPIFAQTGGQETLIEQFQAPNLSIKIPGLNFSSKESVTENSVKGTLPNGQTGDFLVIPFLGEYISAMYKYGLVAMSIIAVIVIIVSGIQWTASAGNSSIIGSAKERIVGAIVGLLIGATSYVILFTVNPNLVAFNNLQIYSVETVDFPEPEIDSAGSENPAGTASTEVATPAGPKTVGPVVKTPTEVAEITSDHFRTSKTYNSWVSLSDSQKKEVLPYLYVDVGSCVDQSEMVHMTTSHCNWSSGKNDERFFVNKNSIPAREKAFDLAEKYGYEICNYSSYRSIGRQTELWNGAVLSDYLANKPKWQSPTARVARPSCSSPHMFGYAMDVGLKSKKTGKMVVSGTNNAYLTKTQDKYKQIYFSENPPYKLILEEILRQAGWVRYCGEYWHFESDGTKRYAAYDKQDSTRCVHAFANWKIAIPDDVKAKANAAVEGGNLFE